MTSPWQRLMCGSGLLLGLSACVGTPVTEPPGIAPPDLPQVNAGATVPELHPSTGDAARSIGLSGEPGAAPSNSLVWILNLDGLAPPTVLRADVDGSFEVPVEARVGDELRLHVVVNGEPSLPLDMRVDEGLALVSPDRSNCVRTTPAMLDFGTIDANASVTLDLAIDNTCDEPVDLAASLHPASTDFQLGSLTETTLAAGEGTSLSIAFEPAERRSLVSGVVLLNLSLSAGGAAVNDRLAVSLWGRVR